MVITDTMRVMVLWSGGVESTSLMKHLLQETKFQVHAHFIRFKNPEGRLELEALAIEKLTPMLQAIRPFEYSESEVSICDGKGLPWDYSIHYTIGVAAMRCHNCVQLLRAGCVEDEWIHVLSRDSEGQRQHKLVSGGPVLGDLHKRRAKILEHNIVGATSEEVAPWLDFYMHTKGWHMQYLGELAKLTWSCRTPENGAECGTCHTCLEMKAGRAGSSYNPAVRELMQAGTIT